MLPGVRNMTSIGFPFMEKSRLRAAKKNCRITQFEQKPAMNNDWAVDRPLSFKMTYVSTGAGKQFRL
jgi:hypothetical protein